MLHFKSFIVKLLHAESDIDETAVNQFLASSVEVLDYQVRFCRVDNTPAWAILIVYQESDGKTNMPAARPTSGRGHEAKPEPELREEELPLYNALKQWRAERAKRENTPPYVYFLNQQLAALVRAKPKTMAELKRVAGIGSAKIEKYGREVMDVIKKFIAAQKTTPAPTSEEATNAPES